jgi:glycosyltransferase involved in cell wall biosynthesis
VTTASHQLVSPIVDPSTELITSPPIRVLSVIQYPTFGGPHGVNLRLAPALEKLGAHLTVLLPDQPGNAEQRFRSAGVACLKTRIDRLRASFDPRHHFRFVAGFPRGVAVIRRIIRQKAIDVVMIHGLRHPHGAIAARLEGIAVAWVITDVPRSRLQAHVTMRVIDHWADVVLFTGKKTVGRYTKDSPRDKFFTYLPPVDISDFRPDPEKRAAARRELGCSASDLVIGNIANVLWYKDHRTFIRAAAVLRQTHRNTRFVILGATYPQYAKYTDSLWREAAELGLRLGVDLIQQDAGGRVADLARAFDVYWMTSSSVETGPAAVEEAMALALPVVTTDCGSVEEMIEESHNGFITPIRSPERIANVTAHLLDNPGLRQRVGAEARRVAVRQFNTDNCAEIHNRALRFAIAQRHPPKKTGD